MRHMDDRYKMKRYGCKTAASIKNQAVWIKNYDRVVANVISVSTTKFFCIYYEYFARSTKKISGRRLN